MRRVHGAATGRPPVTLTGLGTHSIVKRPIIGPVFSVRGRLAPAPRRRQPATVFTTAMATQDEDLKILEQRVDELIRVVERLKDENRSLRESHTALVNERAELIEKTEQARTRVEAMIARLRAMEQG